MVVVGVSGMGLCDLSAFLAAVPADFAAPILAVLHRSPDYESGLREILAAQSAVPVVIADNDELLLPGICYIGRPTQHLMIAVNHRSELMSDPSFVCRNRTIDALFISAAHNYGAGVIGILGAGSLSDGSIGMRTIKAVGGVTMVCTPQDGVWGDMPRNSMRLSDPDFIGPASCLAQRAGAIVGHSANALSVSIPADIERSQRLSAISATGASCPPIRK
jgi:two-component system chemotaxis response regulator CheB